MGFTCRTCGKETGPDDQFCIYCGRRAAALHLELGDGEPLQLKPGQNVIEIPICNRGPAKLDYSLKLETPGYLEPAGRCCGSLAAFQDSVKAVFEVKQGAPEEFEETLLITTDSGRRQCWWNRTSTETTRVTLHVRRQRHGRVTSDVRALLFPDGGNWQTFVATNDGEVPVKAELAVPKGYRLAQNSPADTAPPNGPCDRSVVLHLKPQESARVWVNCENLASAEAARVTGNGLAHEIQLLPMPNRRSGTFAPRRIVGVDFGTVNSSVLIRDMETDRLERVPRGEERFPSLLYVPFDAHRKVEIGAKAERWVGHESGMVIQGIKTLIRLDEEPYVQEFGERFRVAKLLELYLKSIKRLIDEALEDLGWPDQGDVLYVFTLPVLDAGEMYERQRERMRRAAVAAGFPDSDDALSFLAEPIAAAIFAVRNAEEVFGKAPPSEFTVVDAGGGTTDVCHGWVEIDQQGRWAFLPDTAFSLEVDRSEATEYYRSLTSTMNGLKQSETQLGGNVVDCELAWAAEGRSGRRQRLLKDAWRALYSPRIPTPTRVFAYLRGIRDIKEALCATSDQPVDLRERTATAVDFQRRFYDLLNITPPSGDLRALEEMLFLPDQPSEFTYVEDVVPIVQALWEQQGVGNRLRSRLPVSQQSVVVPVGGCSSIPAFQDQLEEQSGARVAAVPEDLRLVAVVRGAVYACDAMADGVLGCPVRMRVGLDGSNPTSLALLSTYQPIRNATPRSVPFRVVAGQGITAYVEAQLDGQWMVLAASRYVTPTGGNVSLRAEYSSGRLGVRWQGESSEIPVWEIRA